MLLILPYSYCIVPRQIFAIIIIMSSSSVSFPSLTLLCFMLFHTCVSVHFIVICAQLRIVAVNSCEDGRGDLLVMIIMMLFILYWHFCDTIEQS